MPVPGGRRRSSPSVVANQRGFPGLFQGTVFSSLLQSSDIDIDIEITKGSLSAFRDDGRCPENNHERMNGTGTKR
jgi:hypothetical protein